MMGANGLVAVMALVGLVGSGEPTVGFRLQDHRGAWHTLDEVRDREVVVLVFLGAECPLAEAYAPRLAEVARDFGKRGVGFFGVDANQQDGPVAIGRFAEKHGLPFPILKDVGNDLADHREAVGWSSMIAEVGDDGRMPPWHASPEHGKFANDARLSADEKRAIRDWVGAGSPEGDPADLPPPPRFVEGWQIPRPDVVLEMPLES